MSAKAKKNILSNTQKPLVQLKTGDSILVSRKDGKWKPAKVTGSNENGPCSYNIITPQGQRCRRNRKDLKKITSAATINTHIDNFLDDQVYDFKSSEALTEPYRTQQPPAALTKTLRHSQRTVRTPVRYAEEFS